MIGQVDVVMNVVSSATSAPVWAEDAINCPRLKRVPENAQINSVFFRCFAFSPTDPKAQISYRFLLTLPAGDHRGLLRRRI